jgi:CheY-like chemotaxis protein
MQDGSGSARTGRPQRVLIVEPDYAARIYAAQLTAELGFRVILAASVEEALAAIEKHAGRLDAVLANLPAEESDRLGRAAAPICPELRLVRTDGGAYSADGIFGALGPARKGH